MADPLSIAASIYAIISVSTEILSSANKLITSGKDMPTSIRRIRDEMHQLHTIFGQVQVLLGGHGEERSGSGKEAMCPVHHLNNILSVSVSRLDKILKDAGELVGPSMARRFLMRVKWALWREGEAWAIIGDLQRHKSSLHLMLTIIQRYVVASCI